MINLKKLDTAETIYVMEALKKAYWANDRVLKKIAELSDLNVDEQVFIDNLAEPRNSFENYESFLSSRELDLLMKSIDNFIDNSIEVTETTSQAEFEVMKSIAKQNRELKELQEKILCEFRLPF